MMAPPKLVPRGDWQNPALIGQFQPHICLLSLGRAFHVCQGPAAYSKLLCKGTWFFMIDSTACLQNLRGQHGDSPSVSVSPSQHLFLPAVWDLLNHVAPIAGQLELWFETAKAFLTWAGLSHLSCSHSWWSFVPFYKWAVVISSLRMALPPELEEAHLVFCFLLHCGKGRSSSFVFYFGWLSWNHWLLKMVWLWEALNLGRVSLPPFGACTVYQDFSLNRHNVKDTMEQYDMLQYSRSGAPWTV